ncbi:MAG: HAD family phosphatase [Planctomycetes bacterium]|nr:HAD family phosphatase [Planctomycetota bacterium]
MAKQLPRNVVFDVGNVLLSWDTRALLREHLPAGLDQDHFRREIFEHSDWVDLDRGTLDEEQALLNFRRRTGAPLDLVQRLVHASKAQLTPMPESLAFLEELHRAGVSLYVLSNMSHATWDYLRPRHDWWNRFHGIVISAQLQLVKPDPAIYRHLLQKWSLDPAETVFFDDRAENIRGARDSGLQAHLFDRCAPARTLVLDGRWRLPAPPAE